VRPIPLAWASGSTRLWCRAIRPAAWDVVAGGRGRAVLARGANSAARKSSAPGQLGRLRGQVPGCLLTAVDGDDAASIAGWRRLAPARFALARVAGEYFLYSVKAPGFAGRDGAPALRAAPGGDVLGRGPCFG
jgi:hypothetical protein